MECFVSQMCFADWVGKCCGAGGEPITPLIPGPNDIIVDTMGNTSVGGSFDLATGKMTLGVVTRYEGPLTSISATHGGEPLELVRLDYANGVATAIFYGNGLTMERAELVVTPVGGTFGPTIMRMRDDFPAGNIATDWNDGKTSAAIGSGWVTTNGMAADRRILYARGSDSIYGNNNMNVMSSATVNYGIRGAVLGGDYSDPLSYTWEGTEWAKVGDDYVFTPAGLYRPLNVAITPVTTPVGAKITYSAEGTVSARLQDTLGGEMGTNLPAGENLTAYIYTYPDSRIYDGVNFHSYSKATIHKVESISSVVGLHAMIGSTVGLAPNGWGLQGASNPAGNQALSAFSIFSDGSPSAWDGGVTWDSNTLWRPE